MGWIKDGKKISFKQPKIYRVTRKENKKLQFNFKILWGFLVLVLIAIIMWWLFYSDFFNIKFIEINGELNESVFSDIEKFYGENILLFSIGQEDKQLSEKQTSIKSLNVVKGIPDTLIIDVNVRDPKIVWHTQGKEYYIDENGIIFNLSEAPNTDSLVHIYDSKNLDVYLGSKIVTDEFIDFVEKINNNLPNRVDKEIEKIEIAETTMYVKVTLRDSYYIYFSTENDVDDQLEIIDRLDKKNGEGIGEYVDLRVNSKAYYK